MKMQQTDFGTAAGGWEGPEVPRFPEDAGGCFSHGGLGRAVSWHGSAWVGTGSGCLNTRMGFRPVPFPVKHPPRGKERQDIRDKTHSGRGTTGLSKHYLTSAASDVSHRKAQTLELIKVLALVHISP